MLIALIILGVLTLFDLALTVVMISALTHLGESVEHDIVIIDGELERVFDHIGYYRNAPDRLLIAKGLE